MNDLKRPWILAGYEIFSKEGPKHLKVEILARKVNKSKSSFYHHFSDLELFIERLLDYHLERSKIIADRERACAKVVPDLLLVIVDYKEDLLFNRQLRIHRNVAQYQQCFEKTSQEVGEAIVGIWSEYLGLADNSSLTLMVLKLSLENFYLQITPQTLNYEWLLAYVKELQTTVRALKNHEKAKPNSLS